MKGTFFFASLVALAFGVWVLGLLGFRFNLSRSLPLGVYRTTPETPARGSIVHVCLPRDVAEFARARGYLGPGSCPGNVRPLGKLVLAVEGDVVTLGRDEIRVNGAPVAKSGTVSMDSRGRRLPHFPWGVRRLRRGELWLFSPYHPSAYDSRYFGPVHRSNVISVLRPLRRQARIDRAPADRRRTREKESDDVERSASCTGGRSAGRRERFVHARRSALHARCCRRAVGVERGDRGFDRGRSGATAQPCAWDGARLVCVG